VKKSKWIKKWNVPRSTGEGTWTVSQDKDQNWGCSCPRWIFHREEFATLLKKAGLKLAQVIHTHSPLFSIVEGVKA